MCVGCFYPTVNRDCEITNGRIKAPNNFLLFFFFLIIQLSFSIWALICKHFRDQGWYLLYLPANYWIRKFTQILLSKSKSEISALITTFYLMIFENSAQVCVLHSEVCKSRLLYLSVLQEVLLVFTMQWQIIITYPDQLDNNILSCAVCSQWEVQSRRI